MRGDITGRASGQVSECARIPGIHTCQATVNFGTNHVSRAEGAGADRFQKNAVRAAESYLDFSGFSMRGLIDQLSSEYGDGFSETDAKAAVNSMDVDWKAQAVRSAKSYLEMQGMSCKGLIEQLSSSYGDKYTKSEATYGAEKAGAC